MSSDIGSNSPSRQKVFKCQEHNILNFKKRQKEKIQAIKQNYTPNKQND